ncbi:hypothetical protein BJL95_20920 [Methylomonas sp. LWB]|uniref:type II toxin-antitoxin system VapC family toxin n=1 Tax=Methylomonas sp. LWB TaxID=1905845 RepID=UPI0008DA8BD9|nr:type II toxin-antitoxin system VapC family toxin [Methylomonas sp. LWB]OHX37138.1 hypothetical protein BJL95_20920 [Methylomonas sp. LWB]
MIFFDTNILIYASINQDSARQQIADERILSALKNNKITISPLVFTEYIFVLSKLKQIEQQQKNIEFFKSLSTGSINTDMVYAAYKLCSSINCCKSINDVIHLKFAEQHCNKLITFDSDFQTLIPHTGLEIEILA